METVICDKTLFFKGSEYNAEIRIKLKECNSFIGLSITGTCFTGRRLRKSESNLVCFGQCKENVKDMIPNRLYRIWRRWHLNDMVAGTPKQQAIIRRADYARTKEGLPRLDYQGVCNLLSSYGLYIDDGYKYGSQWLKTKLPESVVEYLLSL